MPVSASIYDMVGRGVQPVEDPQNALLKALKLQGAQQELQTGSMKMDEYRRGVERNNKLQQLLSGDYATPQARGDALFKGGFLKEGQDYLSNDAEVAQKRATAKKSDIEVLDKSLGIAKSFVSQVQTPEQAAAYIEGLYSDAVLGPIAAKMLPKEGALKNIPQDPAQLMRWKAGHMSMTADKLMELSLPKLLTSDVGNAKVTTGFDQFTGQPLAGTGQRQEVFQSPDNAATNARAVSEGAANRAQQERVSLRADARSREATAATLTKPFEVTGPDGSAMLVQQDKQGNIRPVQGYGPKAGTEKPLNDTQSKALLFGSRMREAGKVLDALAKDGTSASVPGSRAGYGIGSTITALSSSKQQQLDQAKRDFVNAVLRRESGAVIADSEFENADKQYFPQIGDSKEVIAQKKRNRELATNGILQEVPANRRDGLQPQAQMPSADDIRKQADNILKGG